MKASKLRQGIRVVHDAGQHLIDFIDYRPHPGRGSASAPPAMLWVISPSRVPA